MKVLVISDSHGHLENLKHVMGFGKKIKAGAVIHCGDWNNIESVETVLSYKIPLHAVVGNADISPEIKKKFGEFLEIKIDGKRIGVTHKLADIAKMVSRKKFDIIFHGHTHKVTDTTVSGVRVVNPGALVKGINFAVYDTSSGTIEFVHE